MRWSGLFLSPYVLPGVIFNRREAQTNSIAMLRKITSAIFVIASFSISYSQNLIADFEDLSLGTDTFYNGADFAGSFMSGGVTFPNNYDTAGGLEFWTGFSYSNMTDTATAGFMNQYSCYAGSGNNGSSNFGIYYSFTNDTINFPMAISLPEMYITNNTYAAISMRDGDGVAKKFGGASGNDPDYFRVRFQGFDGTGTFTNEVVFYLADFRSSDNSQDYIVKDWEIVDLSQLGAINSFAIVFESSDTGMFGINTPTYFCLDDFKVSLTTGISIAEASQALSVFPNPSNGVYQLKWSGEENQPSAYQVYSIDGQLMKSFEGLNTQIDISDLGAGNYLLVAETERGIIRKQLIKAE